MKRHGNVIDEVSGASPRPSLDRVAGCHGRQYEGGAKKNVLKRPITDGMAHQADRRTLYL